MVCCSGPETIAFYVEGEFVPAARTRKERHVARCDRRYFVVREAAVQVQELEEVSEAIGCVVIS